MTTPSSGISATERRELRKIVEARFAILANDLKLRGQDFVEESVDEAAAAFAAKTAEADNAHAEVREVLRRSEDEITKIIAKYNKKGVEVNVRYGKKKYEVKLESEAEFTVPGKTEALGKARSAAQRLVNTAQTAVERKKLDVLTELAMTAIDSEAAASFAETLPSVDDMLALAAEQVDGGKRKKLQAVS